MKRIKYSLPCKALEKLFTCRIRPIIVYVNFIYDNCPKCPHYTVQRTELLVAIRDLITPNTHHSLLPTLAANRLTIILLKGSDDLVTIENAFIFRFVQKFIKSSNRFS